LWLLLLGFNPLYVKVPGYLKIPNTKKGGYKDAPTKVKRSSFIQLNQLFFKNLVLNSFLGII